MKDGWSEHPRAIAADRETAVHIDPATGMRRSVRDAEASDAVRLFHERRAAAATLRTVASR